jgi:hypothetical protein
MTVPSPAPTIDNRPAAAVATPPAAQAASTPSPSSPVASQDRIAHFADRNAREVLLLRAYESQISAGSSGASDHAPSKPEAPNALWTNEDSLWASRVAADSVGPNAKPADFITARAHAAMQRLAPRDPLVRKALEARGWRLGWVAAAALLGLVMGAVVYDLGTQQRIDLLSVPVWLVVLWNLAVYAVLVVSAARGLTGTDRTQQGRLRRLVAQRLAPKVSGVSRKTPALAHYASLWSAASWPMTAARAGVVLHVGAAALALGLIGGMYLRGLVLDYRAGWQSTFLEPPTVQRWLGVAMAPASRVTGLALPDEAGVAALRIKPGQDAQGPASTWIHLFAATLGVFVVVPRLLLGLVSGLRGNWLSRRLPLSINDPYHHRLLQQHLRSAARVRVHPHGSAPEASAALGLQRLITRVFGDKTELALAPLTTYGAEEGGAGAALESDTVKIALFDLSATPEVEAQGRFVKALRERASRGTSVLLLIDEAGFNSRFGLGERGTQRRAAWDALAEQVGAPKPVYVNLTALDLEGASRAVEQALQMVATDRSAAERPVGADRSR